MKEKIKRIILNSVIIFIIFFMLLLIFQVWQDFKFYGAYSNEDFERFFSVKDILGWDLQQSFFWGLKQLAISLPIFSLLELTKMKNIYKIIIALILIFIINLVILRLTFSITF